MKKSGYDISSRYREALITCLGVVLMGFLYYQPIYFNLPIYYDSGVFAYMGKVINLGGLPYVDAVDHKGAYIYLFNSFGLRLFNGEIRGVYVLEFSLCVFSLVFALVLIKKVVVSSATLCAGFIALVASYGIFFEGGNLPETMTFPWQLAYYSFSAYVLTLKKPARSKIILLALFALIAIFIGLFTRPNNIFGILALTAVLCIRINNIFFYFVFLVGLMISGYLFYLVQGLGVFDDLVNQYLQFNFYYAGAYVSPMIRIVNAMSFILLIGLTPSGFFLLLQIVKNLNPIKSLPFFRLNFVSYFMGIEKPMENSTSNCNVYEKLINGINTINIFYVFFFVAICDILSQLISGRFGNGYLHYGIITLPAIFISSILVSQVHIKVIKIYSTVKWKDRLGVLVFNSKNQLGTVILALFISVIYFNYFAYNNFYKHSEIVSRLTYDIRNNSNATDKIYVSWADAWIYVSSGRTSFTRFFYPNIVNATNFDGKDRVKEMLNEYDKQSPKILVIWKSACAYSFESAFSIEKIRNRLLADYHLKISNPEYAIYTKNQ